MISPVIWLALGLSAAFCCACWYFLRWSLPRRPEDEVKTVRQQRDAALQRVAELEIELAKRQGAYR